MEGLVGERHVPPSTIAGIYVSLGEHADALRWLEQAYRERDSMLTLMNYWPAYDALRSALPAAGRPDQVGCLSR